MRRVHQPVVDANKTEIDLNQEDAVQYTGGRT